MGFENPIVGGTALRIPAIQSPDFASGSAGWIIRIDGSAEFNNLTIRGTFQGTDFIINSSGIFLYSGTPAAGNLTGSWAVNAGTDGFGNAYMSGLVVYDSSGSSIQMDAGSGATFIDLLPATVSGVTWQPGYVSAGLTSRLGTNTPQVQIAAPYNNASASQASISLFGQPQTASGTTTNEVFMSTQRVWITGDLNVVQNATAVNMKFGTESVSFVALSSSTVAVTFATAFASGTVPVVMTNIDSGAGATVRWGSRAISVTNTGFTLFVFKGDAADPAQTWSNVLVQWWAYADK